MRLDIPTITVIASIVFATQTIAVFILYKINRQYCGLRWWLIGAIFQSVGFLLMPTVNSPTLWVLSMLANPLVILGLLFLNTGIIKFLEREERPWTSISSYTAYIAIYFYFIFVNNSMLWRAVVVCASIALVSLRTAFVLFQEKRKYFSYSAQFMAFTFLAYGSFEIFMTAANFMLPRLSTYDDLQQFPILIALFIVPIAVSVLVTLGFVLLVNQRLNSDNITEHKQAEQKIQKLLEEKELILKEVHHRIKNNMSTIYSLLSLQAGMLSDPATISVLMDAGNRIQSMVMLYDKIYKSSNIYELTVRDYLSPLVNDIVSNFANAKDVTIKKHIDDFPLPVNILQPIGMIINELLTNIMKYAFVGRAEGLITVSATLKDDLVSLIVADNGNGIPESIDFGKTTGFGLVLVKGLTQQLNGKIRIERENGTKIILEFQL